ncbi:predicted protein [Aspergillus nidulans FGSC A4]|uniref:Uncharacterized protein n=1 Tax=Emericella nidulans (strain FGSC A4 / ATCC 38163 / CBS 112.46 / NRRL 194 / M139) TaxID=227321 RepID=Q5AQ98_EMENI|nr:hypothetical protein [Aspergillus nidulans FGSC A4]EAA66732.1 predicted protein [Aspergillus nidulans FGSC A4]CBF84311.1 TPA: hypothetical protein ANIA_09532 [Aspergillus nidulans FGSC A4]|eukprot:XP_868914.1 predicted protein [Aspergillus nidulans FGSC A4]
MVESGMSLIDVSEVEKSQESRIRVILRVRVYDTRLTQSEYRDKARSSETDVVVGSSGLPWDAWQRARLYYTHPQGGPTLDHHNPSSISPTGDLRGQTGAVYDVV